MDSDINIARKANSLPILEVAINLNIPEESIIPYGNNKAKIDYSFIKSLSNKKKWQTYFSDCYISHTRWRGQNNNNSWTW